MPEDDDQKVLKSFIAKLEKMTKGYEWMDENAKKMAARQRIFKEIISLLPTDQLVFSPSFSVSSDMDYLRAARQPVMDACKLLATPSDAGYGYRIELRGDFIYEMRSTHGRILRERHEGLFLTLLSPKNKLAGILNIYMGLPIEISAVQGDRLGESMKFLKVSNGQTYDIPLMNHFIKCIGETIYFPKGHALHETPKGIFRLLDADRMRTYKGGEDETPKLLKRLSQYVPEKDKEIFIKGYSDMGTCFNLKGHAPIKDSLFYRARATQARRPLVR